MIRYLSYLAALLALAALRCASPEPCSRGNEEPEEWGPTTLPAPDPGGPTEPGIDPGKSDGDAFGYRREGNGSLCACDWLEHEEGGCSQDPPETCGNGVSRDVLTGECMDELQYHRGKTDPPPEPPPPSNRWHCQASGKCWYGQVQYDTSTANWFHVTAGGWGVTKQDADDEAVNKCWDVCDKFAIVDPISKKVYRHTWLVLSAQDCGRL